MKDALIQDFVTAAHRDDLAASALALARVEYPALLAKPYLGRLDEMGSDVRSRFDRLSDGGEFGALSRVSILNAYLFSEHAFAGNRAAYDDPRNSCLNHVLDRRLGIPVTLGLVYIEVARRAGFHVEGVNFPGRFLLSCAGVDVDPAVRGRLILDPFEAGAVLNEGDCRRLFVDATGEDEGFEPVLFRPASGREILLRMLVNLKRAYVGMQSLAHARDVTELLLALDPTAFQELRDRGLLAYQLQDFRAALRDLETYLRFASPGSDGEDDEERGQIWAYVKELRKRVASYN